LADWALVGYVLASKYRTDIVISLREGPKRPESMARELSVYMSHVSATLSQLVTKGLVECLTPGLKKGRLYALTQTGMGVADQVLKQK